MSAKALRRIRAAKKGRHTTLNLSRCDIHNELPEELGELDWLLELDLSYNNMLSSDSPAGPQRHPLAPLEKLTALSTLDLSRTQVADLKPIQGLTALTTLHLWITQVADLKPLQGLTALTTLNLYSTQVADLKPLKGLTALTSLYISHTKITDLKSLQRLTALTTLDLWGTPVADLKPLQRLTALTTLDLWETPVADLKPLQGLTALTWLRLGGTQVTDLKPIQGLTALTWLDLSGTPVADLKPIQGLTALTKLNIRSTQVADLKPIQGLIQKGVPVELGKYYGNEGIFLRDCPLTNPPLEIARRGNKAILKYWEETDFQPIHEAKVLLVGAPKYGKTTLYRNMYAPTEPMPKEDEKTQGIDIHLQHFPLAQDKEMRLNVWDFGGQEIYKSTHQFFLTKRSLYVLLDDTRESHKSVHEPYFRDWLGWIALLGGDSPILLFQNEKGGHPKTIDLAGIKGQFPQVVGKWEGNLKHPHAAAHLKAAIQLYASQLPHLGEQWPRKWINIRARMEELAATKPHVLLSEYLEICAAEGESDEEKAMYVLRFFHDLGVCLHFAQNQDLARMVILKNEWATEAVFKMLDDREVLQRFGHFDGEDCKRVWKESTYRHQIPELLALMVEFKLCYELHDCTPRQWLVPQMLDPSRPAELHFPPLPGDLVLRYEYVYMPKGLLNQLMARMHRYVRQPKLSWLNGVYFEDGGAELLATVMDTGQQIELRARGHHPDLLLNIIAADLEGIHVLFEKISVKKWLPCICVACSSSEKPHLFDYSILLKRMALRNKNTVECALSGDDVPLLELLRGYDLSRTPDGKPVREAIEELGAKLGRYHAENMSAHEQTQAKLDAHFETLLNKVHGIKEYQSTIFLNLKAMGQRLDEKLDTHRDELRDLLGEIDGAIGEIVKEMSPEEAAKWEALVPAVPQGLVHDLVSSAKLKVPLIPLVWAILSGGDPVALAALGSSLASSVQLEGTILGAKDGLLKLWGRARGLLLGS